MAPEADESPPAAERPLSIHLTEAQLDDIADRAVEKAFARIYAEIGKGVLKKAQWAVGIIITGLLIWAAGRGALPK